MECPWIHEEYDSLQLTYEQNPAYLTKVVPNLHEEAYIKHTRSKLRAHVMPAYIKYVCFMYASSCKRGI